jgi:hypothetical protein
MCQITIQKQKEIAEAEARQSQPKQVLHTASCHSPYILEYVGNHLAASVASASQPQASWHSFHLATTTTYLFTRSAARRKPTHSSGAGFQGGIQSPHSQQYCAGVKTHLLRDILPSETLFHSMPVCFL